MSWQTVSSSSPVARKDYRCMACDWIREGVTDYSFMTFAERRLIVLARRDEWKIKKGQRYTRAYCIYEGSGYTWKARPEIEALCHKYDLIQE